jgi:hypothetical protein
MRLIDKKNLMERSEIRKMQTFNFRNIKFKSLNYASNSL